MNKGRKEFLLERQVAELEQQIECLHTTNQALEQEVNDNKRTILTKDNEIAELRKQLETLTKEREKAIDEIAELRTKLMDELSKAVSAKLAFEKEMSTLINRIKKQS